MAMQQRMLRGRVGVRGAPTVAPTPSAYRAVARTRLQPRSAISEVGTAVKETVKTVVEAAAEVLPGVHTKHTTTPEVKPAYASEDPKLRYQNAIMFQAFGWDSWKQKGWYKIVQKCIPQLQEAGCTHLWLPPPSTSVSAQGYLPSQLYNLNSKYGNKEDIQELNRALKAANITPLADVVINHRCADEQVDGVWSKFRDDVEHPGRRLDWDHRHIVANDGYNGSGRQDTGDGYGPAPDIDHTNKEVQEGLIDWMNWLNKEIGYDGFRFDYVKGFAGEYIKLYVDATIGPEALHVGEFWADMAWGQHGLEYNQDGARQALINWLDKTDRRSSVFDFPLKGILQEAVKNCQYNRLRDHNGKAPGVAGIWPSRAVTFVDNHDTGSTQQHWPFPADHLPLGYAYILTHPGIPCIFWEDYFDRGNEFKNIVKNLIALRKRTGVHARSKLDILCADHDMYVADIDDKIRIKLGPRHDMGHLTPDSSWQISVFGKDFATWEKKQ